MFTIKDFLALPSVWDGQVMTCQGEALERPIAHISVQEMPVENFLQPEELILTTAIGCFDSIPLFLEFLHQAHQAGAAGVVIAKKEDDFLLPKEVLQYGQQHKLPLLMVPWACRFGEMVEQTITALHRERRAEEETYEALKKELLTAFVNNKTMADVAGMVADFLGEPVAVFDGKGNCQGSSNHFVGNAAAQQLPIQMEGRFYGFVAVEKLGALWDEVLLEQAITLPLVLFFGREETIHTTVAKLKNNFLLSLVKEELTEEKKALGRRLGFFLDTHYVCAVGEMTLPGGKDWDEAQVERLLLDQGKQKKRQILATVHQGQILLFYHQWPLPTQEQVWQFLDEMEEALCKVYPQAAFVWGISECLAQAADFRRYYEHALFALRLCKHSGRRRASHQDGILYQMMQQLNAKEELAQEAKKMLAPLLEDTSMGPVLLWTLQVYFEQNHNVSQTARALHIHRQTLLYRLEKIQQLLGISFHRHTDVLLLELFVRMGMD